MINLLSAVGKFIATVFLGAATIFNPALLTQPKQFGSSFTPVQTQKATLAGAGVGLSDTSIILQSFKTPDGTYLTMANFGDIGYGTIEPGTSKEEQISFTGITQNANLTATLTGVSRGLTFVYPYTSSSTLYKAHAGGSTFVISNTAAFYSQFAINKTTTTITGQWTFASSAIPVLDTGTSTVFNNSAQLVTKGYVDTVATSGSPDALVGTKGLVDLSNKSQLAAGTNIGATTASLVPKNSYFNATSTATTTVPVTQPNGKLSQGFIDLTEPFTFTGGVTSTGQTNLTGNTNLSGTLNISSASSTVSGPITFNATTTYNGNFVFGGPISGPGYISYVTSTEIANTGLDLTTSSTAPFIMTNPSAGRFFITSALTTLASKAQASVSCTAVLRINNAAVRSGVIQVTQNAGGTSALTIPVPLSYITNSFASGATTTVNWQISGDTGCNATTLNYEIYFMGNN